ncbi:Centrosomal protein of 95 kDa [Schistosoma japonicum]|nr:Centrosomal protein of 95 kDa [Schistosoma japonicum]
MSLRYNQTEDSVLYYANRLASTVGISKLDKISDINIEFFERILENISDYRHDTTLGYKRRWSDLLQSLSNLIDTPLEYISIKCLLNFNPRVLYSLLEIIGLLAQNTYVVRKNCSQNTKQTYGKSLSPNESFKDVLCEFEKIHNSYLQQNSLPNLPRESPINFESNSYDNMKSGLQNIGGTTKSIDALRSAYLREKLKKCLVSISLGEDGSKNDAAFTRLQLTSSLMEQSLEKYSSSKNFHCGCRSVVKSHAQALVNPSHICVNKPSPVYPSISFSEDNSDLSNQPFSKLLNAFPKLNLDEREERILRKKALSIIQQFSSNSLTGQPLICIPKSQSQNIEEKQRRCLEQLIRHDRQIDNLRQQRASEAIERRIREEAREKKFQLVRARKYFNEFVREFRLKKIAKVNTDEQVVVGAVCCVLLRKVWDLTDELIPASIITWLCYIFRQFFQQLIQKQKEYYIEMKKLEREESLQKEERRKKIIESLEHEY